MNFILNRLLPTVGEGWNLGKRRNKIRSVLRSKKPSFKFAPLLIGQRVYGWEQG
jgi:hypothetical protein